MFGFLNIYKPKGMTSHDVVSVLRRKLNLRQIGHAGTLDPFAEGVLPIAVGKATRLIEFLNDDKAYLATVQFGKNTDTYDIDGEVTQTFDKKITKDDVKSALKAFEGEIMQTPPIFSAIKVKGKKLYEYAREGKEVEIKPRKVVIEKIELKSFDENNKIAEIFVSCSKGTYIRSIAYDLGKNLGCGGFLTNLVRVRSGKFTLENSVKPDEINLAENLINPLDVLDFPTIELNEFEHKKVIQGQALEKKLNSSSRFVILIYNKNVDAVACYENGKIKVKKVFV